MTIYESDEEHWAAIHAAMGYNPTPDQLVADEAGEDQICAAIRDAQRYQDMELPSRRRYHGLHGSDTVREWMDVVMSEHRYGELPRQIKEHQMRMKGMPGVRLPTFDPDAPEAYRSLFAIFADRPHVAHSMRYDSIENLIARKKCTQCYWSGLNLMCADYAPNQLCFARGQFVLIFPTCFACKAWVRAGSPDPHVWTQTWRELREQKAGRRSAS
jgi:hypothetical protein